MSRVTIPAVKGKFETGDRPSGADYVDLIDTLAGQATDLGTAGNNELEINGIESATVVDTISTNQWRMVKYLVSISKTSNGDNKFYATELSILIDANNISVAEYGIIDNDGDVGTISVSRSGGNLELIVTPNPQIRPITVRYARIGLKA